MNGLAIAASILTIPTTSSGIPLDSLSSARSTPTPLKVSWSIFKRGVVGTFHKVSAKYLPLYVAEFQFRYNNRDNADIFGEAIRGC